MGDKNIKYKRVKGTKDILPDEAAIWQEVEETARQIFSLYNYREIRFPLFEKTEVFTKSIGETSDIVDKEMYTFTDRGGESLTLRPEGTASAVRAYVENNIASQGGIAKLYYMGPMFRAERPQAGRFRQFHQIGAEAFGSDNPAIDAEIIVMLTDFFDAIGLDGLEVVLNSLGCPVCRPDYRKSLADYLAPKKDDLCDNCKRRVDINPMRVLDCKSTQCKEIAANAPEISASWCDECRLHFDAVQAMLTESEVSFRLDSSLVRGLDYYTRTAFEVTSSKLGAQDAVAGGGRYNGLVEEFGGKPAPAIGFAVGMERLVSLAMIDPVDDGPQVYLIQADDKAGHVIFQLAHMLRLEGFSVDRAFGGGSVKSQMKRADKSGARFAIIIGGDELASGEATIKDLHDGSQSKSPMGAIVAALDDKFTADQD